MKPSINTSLSDSDAAFYFCLCNTTTFKPIKLHFKLSHYKHRDYWKSTSTHLVMQWLMLGKALVHTRASCDLCFLPENNAYSFGRTTIANLKSG